MHCHLTKHIFALAIAFKFHKYIKKIKKRYGQHNIYFQLCCSSENKSWRVQSAGLGPNCEGKKCTHGIHSTRLNGNNNTINLFLHCSSAITTQML